MHFNLGLIYRDLQQYDVAIAAYQEAIRLDPTNATLHYWLGIIYSLLSRDKEARAAHQRALEHAARLSVAVLLGAY